MTGASNRRRGREYEADVVKFMRANGYPLAERAPGGADQPHGDILGLPAVYFELRNRKALNLAGWMDEATEAAGPHRLPVVVVRRRGTSDRGRDYAVLQLGDLLALLTEPPPTTRPADTPERNLRNE